jgi:hypothetical protein
VQRDLEALRNAVTGKERSNVRIRSDPAHLSLAPIIAQIGCSEGASFAEVARALAGRGLPDPPSDHGDGSGSDGDGDGHVAATLERGLDTIVEELESALALATKEIKKSGEPTRRKLRQTLLRAREQTATLAVVGKGSRSGFETGSGSTRNPGSGSDQNEHGSGNGNTSTQGLGSLGGGGEEVSAVASEARSRALLLEAELGTIDRELAAVATLESTEIKQSNPGANGELQRAGDSPLIWLPFR